MGNYITQSLICTGLLTILILRGYANGISTLSVSQNHSSTDAIVTKNPQQFCGNISAAKAVTRTELFFGLRKPNGSEVKNAEFQRFLAREVTPRFPNGFTVISGQGQFKDARGAILQERSKLLILLYPIAATSDVVSAHAAISVPIDHQQIEQIGKREGWRVLTRKQGDFIPFSAIEFWVENRFLFEFFSP